MYKIEKDEIAIVLRPTELDDKGNWVSGELATGVAMHPDAGFSDNTFRQLIDIVTLMGAFLEASQHDDYIYDTVADIRDELLGGHLDAIVDEEKANMYEVVDGTDNKVVRLTPHTKTKGSA